MLQLVKLYEENGEKVVKSSVLVSVSAGNTRMMKYFDEMCVRNTDAWLAITPVNISSSILLEICSASARQDKWTRGILKR